MARHLCYKSRCRKKFHPCSAHQTIPMFKQTYQDFLKTSFGMLKIWNQLPLQNACEMKSLRHSNPEMTGCNDQKQTSENIFSRGISFGSSKTQIEEANLLNTQNELGKAYNIYKDILGRNSRFGLNAVQSPLLTRNIIANWYFSLFLIILSICRIDLSDTTDSPLYFWLLSPLGYMPERRKGTLLS